MQRHKLTGIIQFRREWCPLLDLKFIFGAKIMAGFEKLYFGWCFSPKTALIETLAKLLFYVLRGGGKGEVANKNWG